MFYHTLNPTLLNLGPVEIRWYGIVYVLGFLGTVWWMSYLSRHQKLSFTRYQIWDLVFYAMLGVLIGSRVFMIFWNPQVYLVRPWELFYLWQGGMSFHGGFVGIVAGTWLYCRKHHLSFLPIADIISVPAIFALALGRIANFINGELWGTITNASWCVDYSKNQYLSNLPAGCRHPNMIYSTFQRFLVGGWLLFLTFRQVWKPGFIFWNFVFWEGLGRIIVDVYRDYPAHQLYFSFSLGQWFSAIMVLTALYFFVKHYSTEWKQLFLPTKFINH